MLQLYGLHGLSLRTKPRSIEGCSFQENEIQIAGDCVEADLSVVIHFSFLRPAMKSDAARREHLVEQKSAPAFCVATSSR